MNRVVITGLGCFCPTGKDAPELWTALTKGNSSINPISEQLAQSLNFKVGSQFQDFQASQYFPTKTVDSLDPFAQYLTIAGREAIADSGLDFQGPLARETAIVTGSAAGGQVTVDEQAQRLYGAQSKRLRPMTIPRFMLNSGAGQLAREFQLMGPSFTVSTACASSNHAIGQAFQMVRGGQTRVAIAGGSEAPFCLGYLKAWEALRVVDKVPCRPFDLERAGISLGEGAGVLILEELEHALARGASIYCEVAGFGMSSDAYQLTKPCAQGAALAMQRALDDARWDASQVSYINTHGTGTILNDKTEAEALHQLFGPSIEQVWVNSSKSFVGHTLGASGAIEAVATALSLRHQIVHPNLRLAHPDPDCGLRLVGAEVVSAQLKAALSNSFAFGGLNATLALMEYP